MHVRQSVLKYESRANTDYCKQQIWGEIFLHYLFIKLLVMHSSKVYCKHVNTTEEIKSDGRDELEYLPSQRQGFAMSPKH